MFRLKSSGLPKDPVFPHDLKGLGYFINSDDEIRNIERPDQYFNFFLTKNERYNAVQREAMNSVIRSITKDRLHSLGLETLRLPLSSTPSEPHIPILISKEINNHSRVIILFYEHTQDLGVFAHRVIGGKGGINEGSAVNFIKHIQSLPSSTTNSQSPGIILANLGQLRWWRRGKQAVSQATWYSLPQKSAVHDALRFDMAKNTVPENRDASEHVNYVINHVADTMIAKDAKLDLIGVGDGAVELVNFFNDKANFARWAGRMGAMALLSPFHQIEHITNGHFRSWLEMRGRAYTISQEQAGMAIGTPAGNRRIPGYGCNTYSLGEPYYSEMLLPVGYKTVIDYFLEVANDSQFENPKIFIMEPEDDETTSWGPKTSTAANVFEKVDGTHVSDNIDAEIVADMVKDATIADKQDLHPEAGEGKNTSGTGDNLGGKVDGKF